MYRKFSADHIFTGYELLQHRVLVTDGQGMIVDLLTDEEAGDEVERFSGVLSPGFVNAHCHLELSHMQGKIPKGSGLVDFVLSVVHKRQIAEAEIMAAMEQADRDMWRQGIVAVGDICNNPLSIPQKKKSPVSYHSFIEAIGFDPAGAEASFERSAALHKEFTREQLPASVVPHAPYSVSAKLLSLINSMPENNLLSIHNQETAEENLFTESGAGRLLSLYEKLGIDISFYQPPGKRSLQSWLPLFNRGQSIIAVHNVSTTAEDLMFAANTTSQLQTKMFYCLCPNANRYISKSLPDVDLLLQHGADIVLGTDSLASNDRLSILDEMKTLQEHVAGLDLPTMLHWVTSNGARALQVDKRFGSFEPGKVPGLVLIEGLQGLQLSAQASARRIL